MVVGGLFGCRGRGELERSANGNGDLRPPSRPGPTSDKPLFRNYLTSAISQLFDSRHSSSLSIEDGVPFGTEVFRDYVFVA